MTSTITTDEQHSLPLAKLSNSTLEQKPPRQTILVGVDGSESADYAFEWVLDHIYHPGDHIIVLKVIQESRADDILLLDQNWPSMIKKFMEEEVKHLHSKYMSMVSSRFSRYSISSLVKAGDPRIVLREMGREENADMIVLGTRGLGLVKRVFMGSVSSYCIKNPDIPTIIVPLPKKSD